MESDQLPHTVKCVFGDSGLCFYKLSLGAGLYMAVFRFCFPFYCNMLPFLKIEYQHTVLFWRKALEEDVEDIHIRNHLIRAHY